MPVGFLKKKSPLPINISYHILDNINFLILQVNGLYDNILYYKNFFLKDVALTVQCTLSFFQFRGSQFFAQYLADIGLGQFAAELNFRRKLINSEALSGKGNHFLLV